MLKICIGGLGLNLIRLILEADIIRKYFDGSLRNWDAEILRKIPNGELAEQIFDLCKPLLDIITDNLDKIKKLDIKKF